MESLKKDDKNVSDVDKKSGRKDSTQTNSSKSNVQGDGSQASKEMNDP